jgi:molecular chaperone DnaK (HSP70)
LSRDFGELVSQWEKSTRDPNEIYFRSQEHKAELKEQIKELQEALKRQEPEQRPRKLKARKPKTAKRKPAKHRE